MVQFVSVVCVGLVVDLEVCLASADGAFVAGLVFDIGSYGFPIGCFEEVAIWHILEAFLCLFHGEYVSFDYVFDYEVLFELRRGPFSWGKEDFDVWFIVVGVVLGPIEIVFGLLCVSFCESQGE